MNTRKTLITLGVAGALFMVGWVYLFQGKLVAETSAQDVTITVLNEDGEIVEEKQGNRLAERLNPAHYTVVISKDSAATKQTVKINSRKNTHLNLGLTDAKSPILVASELAASLNITDSALIYLNANSNKLMALSSSQVLPAPFIGLTDIVKAAWLDRNKAIIKTAEGQAFYLNSRQLTDISQVPEVEDPAEIGSIAADPLSKNYAYSQDRLIFLSQNLKKPRLLTEYDTRSPNLAVSKKHLAVWSFPEGFPENTTPEPAYIYPIGESGRSTLTEDKLIMDVTWAEDAKHLAFQTPRSIFIYNVQNQSTVGQIAKTLGNQVPILWVDSSRFMHGDSDGIWIYDIDTHTDTKLITMRITGEGFSLTGRQNSDEFYFTNNEDRSAPKIYKFSLGKSFSEAEQKLSEFLPFVGEGFEIEVVNINSPTVVVTTFASPLNISAEQYQTNIAKLRNAALSTVRSHGLDPDKLKVVYLQSRYNPN